MATADSTIPAGLCQCGCGQRTKVCLISRPERGHVAGQPMPYLQHHNGNRRGFHEAKAQGLVWCHRCKTAKQPSEFYRLYDGLAKRCKVCADALHGEWKAKNPVAQARLSKKANLKRNYGMTIAEYDALEEKQKGRCAICGEPEKRRRRNGSISALHVDHDHKTGKVRGLLCHYCNTAIGALRESEALLRKAIRYLRIHTE